MIKRRIAALILAALAALSLCGCKNESKRPAHTPHTYPEDETVVFDKAESERRAREMAEQLLGLGEDYTLTSDGEDYVQGGESILYTVAGAGAEYRIAVNYLGYRYVYSTADDEYLKDTMWLLGKCGTDVDGVAAAAEAFHSKHIQTEGEFTAMSGELIYSVPGTSEPLFEVLIKDSDGIETLGVYGIATDMKTVYTKVGEEFVLSD